jgi:8-oxo-dGTP pyrophosphatase MutT (NUDIX family)
MFHRIVGERRLPPSSTFLQGLLPLHTERDDFLAHQLNEARSIPFSMEVFHQTLATLKIEDLLGPQGVKPPCEYPKMPFPTPFQSYRPRHHKVFGCICIRKDNKILLVRGRQTGKWSFPKGHMKGNETSHQCALRELFEETGILMNTSEPCIGHKKLSIGEYFLYEFTMDVIPEVQDTCEVCDIGWFSLEDMNNLCVNRDVSTFTNLITDIPTEVAIHVI